MLSIWANLLATAGVFAVGGYFAGWVDGAPGVLGFVLAVIAGWMLVGRTLSRMLARGEVAVEAALTKVRQEQERADNTGVWFGVGDLSDQALYVRYDPDATEWWVKGWISDNLKLEVEERWTSGVKTLAQAVREAEDDGLIAVDDPATWRVQGWLGMAQPRY